MQHYPEHSLFGQRGFRLPPLGVLMVGFMLFLFNQVVFSGLAGLLGQHVFGYRLDDVMAGKYNNQPLAVHFFRLAQMIIQLGGFGFTALSLAYWSGDVKPALGFAAPFHWKQAWVPCLVMLLAVPAIQLSVIDPDVLPVPDEFQAALEAAKNYETRISGLLRAMLGQDLPLNLLAIALIPAFAEELFFRGFVQGTLSKTMRPVWAAVITAFIFSAMHMQLYGFFARFFLGLMFGLMVIWTGSLWPAMLAHFVNNAANVVVAWLSFAGYLKMDVEASNGGFPWWLGLPSGLLALLLLKWYQQKLPPRPENLNLNQHTVSAPEQPIIIDGRGPKG